MRGESKTLREVLGLASTIVRDNGIRQIHIYSTCNEPVSEYHIDLRDTPSEEVVKSLYDLMENDDTLKSLLDNFSKRVEVDDDKDSGKKALFISVTPYCDEWHRMSGDDNYPRGAVSIRVAKPKKQGVKKLRTFKEILQDKVDAAKAYLNKYNEVK